MITRTASVLVLGALLASTAATQQTLVFPGPGSSNEGDTWVDDHTGGLPWWSNPSQVPAEQCFRSQVITDLPGTMTGNIAKIAYRRDGAFEPGFNLEQLIVELEVTVSTAPTTAISASPAFASNVGTDAVQVISRKLVAFGAKPFSGTFPEPFNYGLLFDQAFPYDASKGSLCIDVKHYGNDMQNPFRLTPLHVRADAMTASGVGPTLANASRCFPPNPYQGNIELFADMVIDDSAGTPMVRFDAWRHQAQHHSRGFLIVSSGLLPNPVPVPDVGSGACGEWFVDLNQQHLFVISSSNDRGICRWPSADPSTHVFELPYQSSWAGGRVYCQELNYNVHTQEYMASNWVQAQVPVYLGPGQTFPIRVVHADGPTSHTDVQGTVGPLGTGPVIEYTY